ncbi:hypothetical protein D3C77_569060 [compost metagenome]
MKLLIQYINLKIVNRPSNWNYPVGFSHFNESGDNCILGWPIIVKETIASRFNSLQTFPSREQYPQRAFLRLFQFHELLTHHRGQKGNRNPLLSKI